MLRKPTRAQGEHGKSTQIIRCSTQINILLTTAPTPALISFGYNHPFNAFAGTARTVTVCILRATNLIPDSYLLIFLQRSIPPQSLLLTESLNYCFELGFDLTLIGWIADFLTTF